MKPSSEILIWILALFLIAAAANAQDDLMVEIENLGNIRLAYTDLVIEKGLVEYAGDLKNMYDNKADKLTVAEIKSELNSFYKDSGLKQPYPSVKLGFKIERKYLIILAVLAFAVVIYLFRSRIPLRGKLPKFGLGRVQEFISDFGGRFRKKSEDVVEVIKNLAENEQEALANERIAEALNAKVTKGELAELKGKAQRESVSDEVNLHIGRLDVWTAKVNDLLSSIAQITSSSIGYITGFEKRIESEEDTLKTYRPEFLSADIQERIKNLAEKTAKEKQELLSMIKTSNELNFALGHFKEKIQKQVEYIKDEKSALKKLLKALKKNNNKAIIENAAIMMDKTKKILLLFSPKKQEEAAAADLTKIKTDIFEILSEFHALKAINLEKIRIEAEMRGMEVKRIVTSTINAKQSSDNKRFIVSMDKLFEKAGESYRGMRITLIQGGVDEKSAKNWVDEYSAERKRRGVA